ncbi:hypothetical protein [Nitratireductor sp. ZSWI3]|uniref:hypothetical protein n=1 Tax=Nitratireductor sp. ZSWI3 TaxID=2966359 RepID=UPI00214FB449|nr:hypothetical protein [Nitratireductor sp. ZSWI3]MCR4268612.1 hypothetical protein [Nitratireductor sp. ZSWI3]
MPTNFASVHTHLENAQAALTGSDPATQQLREAIGLIMDAALKAQFSERPESRKVVPFPGGGRDRATRSNSRHG